MYVKTLCFDKRYLKGRKVAYLNGCASAFLHHRFLFSCNTFPFVPLLGLGVLGSLSRISFAVQVQRKTPRSEIDAEGPVFWWHQQTAKSQWLPPEEIKPFELDRERKMAKALPKGSGALALPSVDNRNNAGMPGAIKSSAPGAEAALSSVRLTPPTSSRVPSRRGSRRLSVLGADGVAELAAGGGSWPGSRPSSRGNSRPGSRPSTPGSRPGTPGMPSGGGQFADMLGMGAGEDPESVATEDEAFMTRCVVMGTWGFLYLFLPNSCLLCYSYTNAYLSCSFARVLKKPTVHTVLPPLFVEHFISSRFVSGTTKTCFRKTCRGHGSTVTSGPAITWSGVEAC